VARLSEIARMVLMLSATSRSGEEFIVLSESGLAQARRPRLSEISRSCVMFLGDS